LAPVDVCVDHGIGQQHVVDDFPEFINAGMRQGLVAAELDAQIGTGSMRLLPGRR